MQYQMLQESFNSWTPGTSLGVSFLPSPMPANIRVAIVCTNKHPNKVKGRSALGTEALAYPANQATMEITIGRSASEKEIRRVMFHESGHSFAVAHEHAHPRRPWQWILHEVFQKYGAFEDHLSTSEQEARTQRARHNVIHQYDATEVDCSDSVDFLSVMLYPNAGMTDGSVRELRVTNPRPSDQDLEGVRKAYPLDGDDAQ